MTKQPISHLEKTLNVWAIVLILWSLYRAKFGITLPLWFDEFIVKPIIFLIPVFYFIHKIEKKKIFQSVGFINKNILKENVFGLILGLFLISLLFLGSMSNGIINSYNFIGKVSLITFIYFLLISFATSFSEEILSRGFVLVRIYEKYKNIYLSSFFGAILYFFIHIPIIFTNTSLTGDLLLKVSMIDLILGFILSLIFLLRKNIIAPIFIHAFYNLFLYLII